MTVAALEPISLTAGRPELVPLFFDAARVVTPDDNPDYTPAMLADLLPSIRGHGQLVPGWVCPAPDLPDGMRLCLEGNRRLAVARQLGLPFWAFDLGRFVPEDERIVLTFQHNHSRRVMSRDEIAQRAARYIEITCCTDAEAARLLHVSAPTLSRAFGEKRIPAHLRERADRLGLSVRSLIAAVPEPLMARAIAFAETPAAGGDRKPTRDQVALFLRQLKQAGGPKPGRAKAVTLRVNGRAVTVSVGDKDSALAVLEDLKAVVARLAKHPDVKPEGWPFLLP